MGAYDADIAVAQELINEFGQPCFWRKPASEQGGTPGYPGAGETPEPIPCSIAFFSGRDLGRGSAEFIAALLGTEVPLGEEIGLLAGGIEFTPELTDTVSRGTVDAAPVAIKKIDRLAPNGTPILYYMTVS